MIKFCQKILLCATSWVKKERRQVFFFGICSPLSLSRITENTPDVKTQTILFQDAKTIAFIAEDFKRLKVTVWIEWAHLSPCRLILSSWGRVHDPFIHTSHDLQQFIAGVSEQQGFCSACGCFFTTLVIWPKDLTKAGQHSSSIAYASLTCVASFSARVRRGSNFAQINRVLRKLQRRRQRQWEQLKHNRCYEQNNNSAYAARF